MISADRDALVCDLAETYGIFDFKALPVDLLATLCVGLRADSRIKMRMNETKVTRVEMLLAACLDRLSMLWWAQTEDGHANQNRPKSILAALTGEPEAQQSNVESFASADDFISKWESITGVKYGQR